MKYCSYLQHPSNYVFQLHYNYIRLHLIFLSHFTYMYLYVLFPIYVAVSTHRQVYISVTTNVCFFPFQITPQGAVENEDTSSGTPNNSSTSSPAQPNNSWRRTHSYEKLDFTDVMPPPPAVTSPTRVFKHSTSVVASEHNGSLLEEAGHLLDTPQKTQKKRPLSSMFPRSSLPSASGTTSGEGTVIVIMLT